ncbi:hypothetical protein [Streptomyces sp. NPDC085479]|uniref:hypothetical protein n=1 Tax=Streptomyces sp. NPDC085479 TaxID=3365726 RepID=UPI0037D46C1F
MSVRRPGEEHTPGNRLVSLRVELPGAGSSAQRCLHDIRRQTAAASRRAHRHASRIALAGLPVRLGARVALRMMNANSTPVVASGTASGGRLDCLGHGIRAAGMFSRLLPGLLSYVSLTRYGAVAHLTHVYDHALPHGADVPLLWAASLADFEGHGHGGLPRPPAGHVPRRSA